MATTFGHFIQDPKKLGENHMSSVFFCMNYDGREAARVLA